MKPHTIFLSSVLWCGAVGCWAGAQADPFQRTAPAQALPSLRGGTPSAPAATTPSPAAPAPASAKAEATFGNPRTSSDGSQTRVVFDLTPGVSYTLNPTFGGLRLDVKGARVVPAVTLRLGASVSEYRAGNGSVTLFTPFPLSLTDGWRASEATLASGGRVLILEFGPTLSGGASASLKALVRTATTPAPPTLALTATPPIPKALADQLPPGDAIAPADRAALPSPPALPGHNPNKLSALAGQVSPGPGAGAALSAPRVGKNPGLTRVVLDLPPGTTYRLIPGGVGLRVELTGVTAAALSAQNISPEVKAWRYEPSRDGVTVTLLTGTPLTERSGWRALLVPPLEGSTLSRLAIDLSPALADLTPLSPQEKVLAAVPPTPVSRGTALLALATSFAKPRVVLDAGHGGKDPGAVGSIVEKEVTLDVALRVRDFLQAAGVDVVLTRDSDRHLHPDKVTDLSLRAGMGKAPGTELFVSIHVNAMDAGAALRGYGIETWWQNNHPLSSSLAGLLQQHLVETTGAYSRGLRSNRSLAVLRESRIPAALVEIGFASHPVDGLNLKDTHYLDRVALGIARGIRAALVGGVTASGPVSGS
ncbi:N-acetylmuramoyl-L-alanine amidase [Deinococcus sp. RL]|uniref:N-acetylmuramoyl-L-alanine amidase n=1 Tax=Deinococcus sp. RL TaxID=1489678 RepID=UPI0004D926FF|nr:N-acetylmuramoyl-L-alanine amidase [Deinococcus sp. RL]KEF34181.1 N-acetylmuramoyl-L-alanine amidase [Deinococcus sp. RL]